MAFVRQVFQIDDLWRCIRALHVVNMKFREIAHNDPTRIGAVGKTGDVATSLLIRRKHAAVRLLDLLRQINVAALLFNQNARTGDVRINEVRILQNDLVFERNDLLRLLDAEDLSQQRKPEGLRLAFFVALPFPKFNEFLCCSFLLFVVHFLLQKYQLLIALGNSHLPLTFFLGLATCSTRMNPCEVGPTFSTMQPLVKGPDCQR